MNSMSQKIADGLGSDAIQMICRLILGGLFIFASIDKIVNPRDFARIIHDYRLIPDMFVFGLAALLPWFEMICGLLLVSGLLIRTPAILLTLLLALFLVVLSISAIRGLDIDCGCFTTSAQTTGNLLSDIIRDISFLVPGILIIFFNRKR